MQHLVVHSTFLTVHSTCIISVNMATVKREARAGHVQKCGCCVLLCVSSHESLEFGVENGNLKDCGVRRSAVRVGAAMVVMCGMRVPICVRGLMP